MHIDNDIDYEPLLRECAHCGGWIKYREKWAPMGEGRAHWSCAQEAAEAYGIDLDELRLTARQGGAA